MATSPNTVNQPKDRHDLDEQEFVFDIDMKESELLQTFKQDFEDSETFWKEELSVKGDTRATDIRELGEKVFKGEYYLPGDLYDHQVPYVDNRIFVSIDTDIPKLTSKVPEPIITTIDKTDAGKRYSQRIQRVLEDEIGRAHV